MGSMDQFDPPNGDCGQAGSAWRGVQGTAVPCETLQIEIRKLDEV